MRRAGDDLHDRLIDALRRSADAHELSATLIEEHLAIDEDVRATLTSLRRERAERARARGVRIRTGR